LILNLGRCLKCILKTGLIYTDLKPQNVWVGKDLTNPLILDLGGFKDIKRYIEFKTRTTLGVSSLSKTWLISYYWSPPEFFELIKKSEKEIKELFSDEFKTGKSTVYPLALMLAEYWMKTTDQERSNNTPLQLVRKKLKTPFKGLIEKALQEDRDKRISLDEFLNSMEEYLRTGKIQTERKKSWISLLLGFLGSKKEETVKGKTKKEKKLVNLRIKQGETVVLKGKTYEVLGDIEIEPGGELVIKNSVLKFSHDGGIVGRDCSLIVENSTFEPLVDEWKNITIGGKIKGNIKGCTFKNGRGRLDKEIKNLLGLELESDETYGGALFIYSTEGDYLISNSLFKDCSAKNGGGVYCEEDSKVENCNFKKCSANKYGGGVYLDKENTLIGCEFRKCFAESGGGIFCKGRNTIKGYVCIDCKPDKVGGNCFKASEESSLNDNKGVIILGGQSIEDSESAIKLGGISFNPDPKKIAIFKEEEEDSSTLPKNWWGIIEQKPTFKQHGETIEEILKKIKKNDENKF
jgi:hypothetical protein